MTRVEGSFITRQDSFITRQDKKTPNAIRLL